VRKKRRNRRKRRSLWNGRYKQYYYMLNLDDYREPVENDEENSEENP
jgi:hypothetical protein